MDGKHIGASEQSEAQKFRAKPVDILINPNLPQASPTFLLIKNRTYLFLPIMFDVGATFEMRETNTEKSIFRLIMIAAAQRLINGRR